MKQAWFVAAVVAVVPLVAFAADTKKKAEKPPRVAFTEVEQAGPDYAIQGEYEGAGPGGAGKIGLQLIADGDGKFSGRLLEGGLPGAGWNNGKQVPLTGTTTDGQVNLTGKTFDGEPIRGTANKGGVSLSGKGQTITLSKVERKSPTEGQKPPAGAVILFDGTSADAWTNGKLVDGKYLNVGVKTKQAFKDFTLHLEFRTPFMPNSRGQGRGNSGLYLQDRYECQVLDSFGLKGLNNECGGFYQAFDPAVNMCFPPLTWQTYDIDFTAAKFDAEGKKIANARATVRHNGVVVQDNVEFVKGASPGGQKEAATPGPLQLQNHSDPVVYRNIWIVEK